MSDKKPPLSKFQKFQYEEIARSQIELAHYNPRKITEGNRKRLSKGISDHGLVEPLIWNKQTGRLVSGHQRIADLDSKHRNADYSLGMAVIDVSESEEAKLNVILNNPSLQGVFDLDAIVAMTKSFKIELPALGFSREDMLIDFGMDLDKPGMGTQLPAAPTQSFAPIGGGIGNGILPDDAGEVSTPTIDPQKALMEAKFAARKEAGYEATSGTFMVNEDDCRLQIVFDKKADLSAFLERVGLTEDVRIVPAKAVLDALDYGSGDERA